MVKEYGYEYDAARDKALFAETKGKVSFDRLQGAICLRSGRDALKAIAREQEKTAVYLPALSCDSMIRPFQAYGHGVCYYKLNSDYSIDLTHLKTLVKSHNGQGIFLYMNYFGNPAIGDTQLQELQKEFPKITFAEDRTHDLIWEKTGTFQPDYTMASLRKWIPIPDGGLLWTKRPLKCTELGEDTAFSETRLKAQCMRREYLNSGDETLKTEFRKIFSTVSDLMDEDPIPHRMSAYSYAIAERTNWEQVRCRRKENAETLITGLKQAGARLIQKDAGRSDLYVAFLTENRDETQRKLSAMGIFNTIIWPLIDRQKETCQTAKLTEEHMLAAPCDQRYTPSDMEYIGKEIAKRIKP